MQNLVQHSMAPLRTSSDKGKGRGKLSSTCRAKKMKPTARYNKSVVLSTGTAIKDLPRAVEEATAAAEEKK